MDPAGRTNEGSRTTRLVWVLAMLGLGAGALILLFVSLALAGLRSAREHHHRTVEEFTSLNRRLNAALSEAREERELLLNEEFPASPAPEWAAAMARALERIRRTVTDQDITTTVGALGSSLTQLGAEREHWRDWRSRQIKVRKELADSRAQLQQLLEQMGAAVTSAEGRQKLQLATYLRRLQKPTNAVTVPLIGELIARVNPGLDLTEIHAELNTLSLLCEQLAGEEKSDQLANLKDNLFSAPLFRLARDLSQPNGLDLVFSAQIGTLLAQFQTKVFGGGYRFDSAHQTIVPGTGGQYNLCGERLALKRERLALLHQASACLSQVQRQQQAMENAATLLTHELATDAEHALASTRRNLLVVGLASAAGFLLLARRIASAIRHQLVTIQQTNRALHEEAASRRQAEDGLRQAKDAAENANAALQTALQSAEKLTHEAQAASRAKSDFLATMSHEIRTPMNGIIGFTDLLLDTPLGHEQSEFAQTIRSSSLALLAIINDILDFSKIEAGRIMLEEIPFDLSDIVEEVSTLLSPNAEAKGLDLAFHYGDDAPRHFRGDPGRVRQILLNLTGNSIKFTARGHILIEVRRARPGQAEGSCPERVEGAWQEKLENGTMPPVEISIRDTGIGIPKEKHALLFQKFSQADSSTTRKFGGTGLGLAISRRLVELMGGAMRLESEPGQGAAFSFTLALPLDTGRSLRLPHDPELPPELPGARILVVDAHSATLEVLQRQLAAWGLTHAAVSSGPEALAQADSASRDGRPFQLALIGSLPAEFPAEELVRRFRSDPASYPAALVAIVPTRRGDPMRALGAGFAACLFKPMLRPPQLRQALIEAWKLHHPSALRPSATPAPAPSVDPPLCTIAQPSTAPRSTDSGLAPAPNSSRRILVAEDVHTNQKLATYILNRLGCRVDIAENGREAVHLARQHRYDLILMDCQMPEMDGYQAAAAIRAAARAEDGARGSPFVPIVALTASAVLGDRETCLAAGMDDYLTKPLRIDDLKQVLARWAPPDVQSAPLVRTVGGVPR